MRTCKIINFTAFACFACVAQRDKAGNPHLARTIRAVVRESGVQQCGVSVRVNNSSCLTHIYLLMVAVYIVCLSSDGCCIYCMCIHMHNAWCTGSTNVVCAYLNLPVVSNAYCSAVFLLLSTKCFTLNFCY